MTAAPLPIVTSTVAAQLLSAMAAGKRSTTASMDLGLTTQDVSLADDRAMVAGITVPKAALAQAAENPGQCFEATADGLRPVREFSAATGWVRTLLPTADAPTTLVAGFAMHRLEGATPLADTRAKVRALGTPRGRALDTATGLGYTAIALARTCTEVVTVERDPAAIALARRNPWSAELFANEKIRLELGDVAERVRELDAAAFATVLHDPPTVQLAGDLYGLAFYRELRRVLRPGGRLFHYVGDSAGRVAGVLRRLDTAGFVNLRRVPSALGVFGETPRHRARRRRR